MKTLFITKKVICACHTCNTFTNGTLISYHIHYVYIFRITNTDISAISVLFIVLLIPC
jgi:uncharacterized membrane protein